MDDKLDFDHSADKIIFRRYFEIWSEIPGNLKLTFY